ncbi:lipopolysaccharide biosynthesis protein [Salinibacterium sp. dk2585]|uniref:lipopolysaccharide biosynthesis protein n=1 Tax=unclassified Salinibacterium TaxID=2632331 RepID=UPI0011C24A7A|nr:MULTISPECIES: lipopolysaccharide biosynthesis protein [unclassified Salinibacterium]QEE60491.1 lipopolysaccharide biosynthesis protein [Salinibacterium sp. dk2585]TXK55563.1 lipopolysaccharide biosynthesis protein [Salinibacterium sp. dk5596]
MTARDTASPGLGRRAARGATVTVSGQILRILVQMASVAVLARLLAPADYGLVAMVAAVIGIGSILRDFGLSSAAIQSRDLSRAQRDTLWWVNTGIGVALTGVVFLAAPLVAALYDQALLEPITRVLAVTFAINGMAAQWRADLVRRLRFVPLAIIEVVVPTVALAGAIVTAMLGWGYWALVAQQIVQALAFVVLFAAMAGWVPRLPRRGTPMRGLLRFGWNLSATQLINYVGNNLDSVIIGVRFGAVDLGVYNRGYQLLMVPLSQLRTPSTTVALPVLSRLEHDNGRFGEFLLRGQLALSWTLIAGLSVIVGAADPLTLVFLGEPWMAAAPVLRLLAVAGILQTLSYVGYWVYLSRALTGELLRYSLVSTGIRIACIVLGSQWGVIGVAAGFALAPAIAWPISLWWLSRVTVIPTRRLFASALRSLALAALSASAAGFAVWGTQDLGVAAGLAAATAAAVGVYSLSALLIPRVRRDLVEVIAIFRMLPKARSTA